MVYSEEKTYKAVKAGYTCRTDELWQDICLNCNKHFFDPYLILRCRVADDAPCDSAYVRNACKTYRFQRDKQ